MTDVPTAAGALLAAALLVLLPLVVLAPPRLLLAAYAFVLPFGSDLTFPGLPSPYDTLSTLVGLAVTLGLAVRLVAQWRSARTPHPSAAVWLVLLGWLVLTLLWSVRAPRTVSTLLVLVSLVTLYLLVSVLPFDRQALRWLEIGAVGGALVVAAQALSTAATGGLEATTSKLPRFTYDEGDPNITAATLLLPLALCMWWALHAETVLRRVAASAASIAIVATIAVTGSRGGLVAAMAVLAVVLTSGRRLPVARTAGYLALAAVAFAVTFLAVPQGLRDHLTDTESTGRSEIWKVGLRACLETCDIGSGYGTFGTVYREAYLSDLSLDGAGDKEYAAHNVALAMLVEGGALGLLLMVGAVVLLVAGLRRLPVDVRGPPLAAVAGLFTANMFVSNLGFKYFWLTLMYATLCLTAYARRPATPGGADIAPRATALTGS